MPERPPVAPDRTQDPIRDRPPSEDPASAAVEPAGRETDALSAMTPRFNFFFRWFANRFFRHFELGAATVATLRELESRGGVV